MFDTSFTLNHNAQRVDDARYHAQQCEQNVDQQITTAAALQEHGHRLEKEGLLKLRDLVIFIIIFRFIYEYLSDE